MGVDGQEIDVSLTTPPTVRKLQEALYVKAKQEPKFRFYSLYDKVHRWDVLEYAWRLSRSKRGAPGVDGVTFDDIEAQGVEPWLKALQEEVRTGEYKPAPVRRVLIPKPGGGERPLGLPTIRDRVLQTAVKLVIEPIFEVDLDDEMFGYRANRSALDALDKVQSALWKGHTQVIDADLTKYFDTIPHEPLLKSLARRISDGRLLHLIKMWLKVPVEERDDQGRLKMTGGKGATCGVPQGGVISPLLANIYMRRFIQAFKLFGAPAKYGAILVNYADDFVILCRRQPAELHGHVEKILGKIGLTLNQAKTSVKNAWLEPFHFLGYALGPWYNPRKGSLGLKAVPAKKALERFRENVRHHLRARVVAPLEDVVASLNRRIVGWGNYFSFGEVTKVRRTLDTYIQDRVRGFLRRRSKVQGRGRRRFSYEYIRGQLGVRELCGMPLRQRAQAFT